MKSYKSKRALLHIALGFIALAATGQAHADIVQNDNVQVHGNLWVQGGINNGGTTTAGDTPVGIIRYDHETMLLYSDDNDRTILRFGYDSNPSPALYLGQIEARNDGVFGLKDSDGHYAILTKKDDYVQFRVNDTPMMTIKSWGSTGIGTTGPSQRLHVEDGNALIRRTDSGGAKVIIQTENESDGADTKLEMINEDYKWILSNDEDISQGNGLYVFNIKSKTPTGSEQVRFQIEQDGKAEFMQELTIPAGGDLSMGTFTETN